MAKLAGYIRHAIVGDRVIVLDLRRGVYATLPPAFTAGWVRLARGLPLSEAADVALASQAQAAGYLADGIAPVSYRAVPPRRLPLALAAFRHLVAMRGALTRRGFPAMYQELSELRRAGRPAKITPQRAATEFLRVEGLLPGGMNPRDCLPRSMALFRLLLGEGLPARHLIGVKTEPFEAHAWVAIEDAPLLENAEEIAALTPISELRG